MQELDRLVDDALVFTGPNGAVYGKEDDLDAHRRGLIRITRLEPSEERIQRFGEIAVVSVRMEMAGDLKRLAEKHARMAEIFLMDLVSPDFLEGYRVDAWVNTA